jgi:hypothetical protein
VYKIALDISWERLKTLTDKSSFEISFMGDSYLIDEGSRSISSLSCNTPAREDLSVLLLHYLLSDLKGIPPLKGEWVSFKDVPEGAFYYSAYRKRAIEPIIRKYGNNPDAVLDAIGRLNAKRINIGDIGLEFNVFDKVPVVVSLYRKDEEFDADANILFDANIAEIFPTEDIAVLGGIIASAYSYGL